MIYRYVREQPLSEDLAQNVFIRFWKKRYDIEVSSSVEAYLRRMAVNEALGWLRKHKNIHHEEITNTTPTPPQPSVEQQFLHTALSEQISAAIAELPPRCRLVFQLSRFEQLTYREIAERLNISVKTVENQMGKALRVLRSSLQPYLRK